jgi:hypothetical protein
VKIRDRGLICHTPEFFFGGIEENTKTCENSRYCGRDSNQSLYEYKSEALLLQPNINEFYDEINNHKEKLPFLANL